MAAAAYLPLDPGTAPPRPAPVAVPELDLAARIAAAEEALDSQEYCTALELVEGANVPVAQSPRLALRALLAESWARFSLGDVPRAVELLERARPLSEQPAHDDVDRAEVLFRLGCCRFTAGAAANALSLLTLALDLCDHSARACDRLRTRILDWRARCYQRQRDWEAARADVERALELAHGLGEENTLARIYFQASVLAERESQWLLARFYAEEAKRLLERLGDWPNVGKTLNNLGGLNALLGDPDAAIACLERAASIAADRGSDVDVGYAVSSLAQVYLREGDLGAAEQEARRALELLGDRADHLAEIGGAQLVLARALLGLGRAEEADEACRRSEESFRRLGSASHRAAAWIAQGDVAHSRGDVARAAELYRRAAEALQDVHF